MRGEGGVGGDMVEEIGEGIGRDIIVDILGYG